MAVVEEEIRIPRWPDGRINFDQLIQNYAREHDMSYAHVLRWCSERSSLEVAAELMGINVFEAQSYEFGVARKRALVTLNQFGAFLDRRGYNVPRLLEIGNHQYERRDEDMSMTLTREGYLAERKAGKTRAQIARDQGISAPTLLYHLGKWGLKDSVVEERELARLATPRVATPTDKGEAPKEQTTKPEPSEQGKEQVPSPEAPEPTGTSPSTHASLADHPAVRHNLREAHSKVTLSVPLTEPLMVASLQAIMADVHQTAIDHGWYDERVSLPVQLALIHSEVSEALEADRKDEGADRVSEELADIIIRVLDTAAGQQLDVVGALFSKMYENRNREYRHGGKKY